MVVTLCPAIMNVVALRKFPADERPIPAADVQFTRVIIFPDMASAEPHWRTLEAASSLTTPYQRYDFMRLWQAHVGAAAGVTPFIAVGFNAAGAPLFLWPFGCRRIGGLRVIEFLGGKHANFNMGLWRRDVAGRIGANDLRRVLADIAGHADMLVLVNQPLTWAGTTNPFALLPQQRAANFGFSGSLVPDFEALIRARTNANTRKKMRKKERALAGMGAVRFERASSPNDVRRVLDAFFKQKSARMRMLGVSDVFAEAGVRRFIEAAATEQLGDGAPAIELYALSVDDMIVATMGGIVGDGRFCAMFNSILPGRYAVESPGEQLIVNLVRQCCDRGLNTFDLGIGESRYKRLFCEDAEPLFDTYLPLTGPGHLLAVGFKTGAAVKRTLKQHPMLWSAVRATRRLKARLAAQPGG
jgi:CelD/BcsL family acetyltransferase involved in cellulose biosynthesis